MIKKQKNKKTKKRAGFTLLEVVLVVTILAVLSAGLVLTLNPSVRFAKSRNNKREADVSMFLNAIGRRIADNKGLFACGAGVLPAISTRMTSEVGGYDIASCLFPSYIPLVPHDPNGVGAHYTSVSDYNVGYDVWQDVVTGRVTVEAPFAELEDTISASR